MDLSEKIVDGGWGALLLFLYTVVLIHLQYPAQHEWKFFGVIPPLLVMFASYVLNDQLIELFAGKRFRQSTREIAEITGEDHYYESLDNQTQDRIDEYDRRAYRQNNSILSGFVILFTSPLVGYLFYDIIGLIVGLLITLLAYFTLVKRAISELNSLAVEIVEVYKENYEN